MNRTAWRWITCAVLASGIGGMSYSRAEDAPIPKPPLLPGAVEGNITQGFTLPDKEYKVCFPTMGVIREVKIKEGDVIKKGDVLMKQDDREEQAELKLLDLDCNDLPIKAAIEKAKAAEVEFQYKDKLKKDGAQNDLEWTRAKAEWDVLLVQIDQAKAELKQKEAKRDKQKQHVESMTLTAASDGVVKDLINDLGSNVDPTKPVITVVQNNPLTVEVQVPALASLQLKKNDKIRVSYDKKVWKDASVSFMSPQADARSGWRKIHLELPNPEGDPSGLQVFVELPEKLLASVDGK
jgi:RND family efflux transporter MFP subunit